MYKFVIPFYYLTYSRLKSLPEKLSLIWIYPIFLFFFLFVFYQIKILPNLFSFLLAFFAWLSIYEIGYLENDALTIKKENHPNLRISSEEIGFISGNIWKITFFRGLIFLNIVGFLYLFNLWNVKQISWFVFMVIIGQLFFYIHNQIRSKLNILSYLFLCLSKYWVFPLIYLGFEHSFEPYWIIFISFPLLRTIEHSVKPKYEIEWLKKWVGSLDSFRLKYYASVLVFVFLFSFWFSFTPILLYSIGYFFLFRMGVWFLIRSGIFSRENLT
jgi:hypothetical protein